MNVFVQAMGPQRQEPLARMLEGERDRILGRAISELPQPQRLIVFLHYYDERPLAEIAEVLHMTAGRAELLHSQALRKMRSALV